MQQCVARAIGSGGRRVSVFVEDTAVSVSVSPVSALKLSAGARQPSHARQGHASFRSYTYSNNTS